MSSDNIRQLVENIRNILPGASQEEKIRIYQKLNKLKEFREHNKNHSISEDSNKGFPDFLEES